MKFKVGDKVRCVDVALHGATAERLLVINRLYVVEEDSYVVEGDSYVSVKLVGIPNRWECSRFISAEKPKPKKYTVPKPFSIIDIFNKNPCKDEFEALMVELEDDPISDCWTGMGSILESKVLKRNLPWLEEEGFIVEKKEEWPWVNVYTEIGSDKLPGLGVTYKTKAEAEDQAGTLCAVTVQLKPKESQ